MQYAIGYDIGSSAVKAALVRLEDGRTIAVARHPQAEMAIEAPMKGWAEQDPEVWWQSLCNATHRLLRDTGVDPKDIQSIGLAYQMHGLVLLDTEFRVLRSAIIWCDSRAVEIGNTAMEALGPDYCLNHLLNSPGNFTASRLKWVRDNEPKVYEQAAHVMLPGDYVAFRMTGEVSTTIPGLSEGIMWDFARHELALRLFDQLQLDQELIPALVPTFGDQGSLSPKAAGDTGLRAGTPLRYRAGDQPNNAFSLGVLDPGAVAATGGTSGVVYGIVDHASSDPLSRVNGFAHVNHTKNDPRIGLLLCINGAGIQYAWIRQLTGGMLEYAAMEALADSVPVGSDGIRVLPFGNGAERMLQNATPGAHILHVDFNRHGPPQVIRAVLEGIAFSFVYGFEIFKSLGLQPKVIRVGNDNLFRSRIFGETVATLLDIPIEMYDTTGAVGAAIGSFVEQPDHVNKFLSLEGTYQQAPERSRFDTAYAAWCSELESMLNI